MKKTTAIILMTALLLTACTNTEMPENSDNPSISTILNDSENSSITNNSTTQSSSSTTPNSSSSDNSTGYEKPEIIESFTAPDGSILYTSDAVEPDYDERSFKFNHSYIRYAKPIFHNTLDEPDLVNWDTLDFKFDTNMSIEDPGTFKVKAGDKLKNGLTVESAEFHIGWHGEIFQERIKLSGGMTLEGVLYRAPEDGYNVMADDLTFFADSTKCDSIPIAPIDVPEHVYTWADTAAEFAMVGDETRIRIGNYNDIDVDLSGIVDRGEYVKAKITIKDIYLVFYNGAVKGISATLVSVD